MALWVHGFFRSYKNRRLKVKLWWVGARKKKNRAFFVSFILSEENFFSICVLFQFLLDWIHFQNIHILHIKNHCSIHFFLVFKTVKSHLLLVLSCVLYDHRRLPFLTFDSESSCSKSEKKFPFSFVVKNPLLWIKNAD